MEIKLFTFDVIVKAKIMVLIILKNRITEKVRLMGKHSTKIDSFVIKKSMDY